ncbi:MAG TPA: hypothetical protein VE623_19695 [Acidimicrobiales bacterium]|jgi:hypothetical protein|nr:hypothetical protein [Acidimicrobiales bacterium]
MSQRWRLLAWTAALALGLRGLHSLGAGPLGVPLTSMDDLSAWVDATRPDAMALALVRLAALAGGWYLAVCTLVLALTRRFGRHRVAAVVARVSPSILCRIVSGGGGLGLAAGTLLGVVPSTTLAAATFQPTPAAAIPADPAPDPSPTATMTRLPATTPEPTRANQQPGATHALAPDSPQTATMTRDPAQIPAKTTHAGAASPPPTATMARTPATQAPAPATAPSVAPAPSPTQPSRGTGSSTWIVEPGDSFWSIAAEIVTVSPGASEPGDRQVLGYWRRLIEANRSRLLDPANPDLLVPGQELVLPHPTR